MSFKPKNFREWCNYTIPILPQVYGDELSYYELLNKVIERCNEIGITVNELIDYVNHYFDSFDFEKAIDEKLDKMATDGTLSAIINEHIFSELNSKVESNEMAINSIRTNKKIVFVGDSYAEGYTPDGNVIGWPTIIKNTISSYTIYGKYEGGSGVVNKGNNGNSFQMLLEELASSLSADIRNSISYVVIGGGFNDKSASESELKRNIVLLSKKARMLFPNAFLYYCIIGWSTKADARNQMRTIASKLTTNLPEPIEMTVITSTMLCLHNYSFFASDGVHPNQNGQNNIADAILRVINGGNTLQLFEYLQNIIPKEDLINLAENNDNPNFIDLGCTINNGMMSLNITAKVRAIITDTPTKIASLKSLPYFRTGWKYPPLTDWMCWLVAYTDENKFVSGVGFLTIDPDGYLCVFHRIADETKFITLNCTKPSSYCNIWLAGATCNSYDL